MRERARGEVRLRPAGLARQKRAPRQGAAPSQEAELRPKRKNAFGALHEVLLRVMLELLEKRAIISERVPLVASLSTASAMGTSPSLGMSASVRGSFSPLGDMALAGATAPANEQRSKARSGVGTA